MRSILLVISLLNSFLLIAHNANEINYILEKKQDNWQLAIHLTPQTAIQLIEHLKPELREQSVIRLADYYDNFTDYFNKSIQVQLENTATVLRFLDADLNHHDAVMYFKILNAPDSFESYSIKIESFVEVFRRLSNQVTVIKKDGTYTCYLNKEVRNCSSEIKQLEAHSKSRFLILGLFLVIVGGGTYIFFPSAHKFFFRLASNR